MKQIYADNASTSFPKGKGVGEAMKNYVENVGVNIHRGNYAASYDTALLVLETRELIAELFQFQPLKNVIFTSGVTAALNFVLKGFLKAGDHVVTSALEHNAVMRTLNQIRPRLSIATCSPQGEMDPETVQKLLRQDTRAVVLNHASNVCGTLLPLKEISQICQEAQVPLIVDAAQTAGVFPINLKETPVAALCFAGHKSLLGPQGIGGFCLSDAFAEQVNPLICGGTGSSSDQIEQPNYLPDKFESGTQNLPGIIGLRQALLYLQQQGQPAIWEQEMALTAEFIQGIQARPHLRLIGKPDLVNRTAVVAVVFENMDNALAADILSEQYGIATRCGLHCAPIAHQTLGTFPEGVVRFSFGHKNTQAEIAYILQCLDAPEFRGELEHSSDGF